jgi:hypothetical protein
MDVRYLILILFILVSCQPSPRLSGQGSLSGSSGTSGGTSSGGASSVTTLKWNYLGENVSSITINVSNYNNAYLVGTPVETYLQGLSNFINEDFCLVGTYLIGGINYELRSRAVPISYYDFVAKRTVRILRVDFQDITNSQSICNKNLRIPNGLGNFINDPGTPPLARQNYNPATICPLCTGMLQATGVRVFRVIGSNLDQVPLSNLNTGSLSMQIDPNFANSGNAGSCSHSDCRSRGFDCCLENQCVNDGSIKPGAYSNFASLLSTAEAEKLQNPLAYLNYPQLYYICGSSIPTNPSGGSGSGSYDPGLIQLRKDYACIQHLKSQSSVTPFHLEVLTKSYTGATDCLTNSSSSTETFYYQNVLMRMYQTCGCNRTNLSEAVTNCPNYEYTVTAYDSNNQPLTLDCYTPPVSPPVQTQQTVSFSGRTAPHRFFDINGNESKPESGIDQEGDRFEYIDEGKILPTQQNFSMNAVLGQMAVTLNQALPAKTVNVELDQVYLISTTSGYYTPCPSCGKDSWLSSFTAFPQTSWGTGLQAIGYTTQRDLFGTNTTGGNYEDTIFGRACWIPPTMIPWTHSERATSTLQRRDRLKTQAALFVNGYQRDWYGFNKGAIIGSFDGVTWFAIGKGRIVRSSSKKLFLAINAPFADVAAPTLQVVNVQAYDGITQATNVDYNPQYHAYHPLQNEAGNCQRYHFCSTDSDCVSKLGWEYACADLQDVRTNWPEFDSEGNERANKSNNIPIFEILQQKSFASTSTKRCVYRGAGSLCHRNPSSFLSGSSADPVKAKLLTCAPNFWCAPINSGTLHNSRIARWAAPLSEIPVTRNHFLGKDANTLGRPLDYIASGTLVTEVRSNLSDNAEDSFGSSMMGQTGLCQPGKALPDSATEGTMFNPWAQHQLQDAQKRTDYISQIGSCNSTLFTSNRHSSCPVMGTDGNYLIFNSPTLPVNFSRIATAQNACGLESLKTDPEATLSATLSQSADTIQANSPFKYIEARPLNSQVILEPTLARDACLRRAGSVCHTDLDCSPNKFHGNQVDNFAMNFFGNQAERAYWQETLVCGQADQEPLQNSSGFASYDLTKNRCCREVGSHLTTYTSDLPNSTSGTSSSYVNYHFTTTDPVYNLRSTQIPGLTPNSRFRYSRFATVDNLGTISRPVLSAFQTRLLGNSIGLNSQGVNVTTANQWKTLNETNSETCCGGGWVRKFSDGTTDWSRRDRVILDVANFRCINSRNPLMTEPSVFDSQFTGLGTTAAALVSQDYQNYCVDPLRTLGGCAQYDISTTAGDVQPQTDSWTSITVNTIKPDYKTSNFEFLFMPSSGDSDSTVFIDYNNSATLARRNIKLKIPSYMTPANFNPSSMTIRMQMENGSGITCSSASLASISDPDDNLGYNGCGATVAPSTQNGCCYYEYNSSSRILKIVANNEAYNDAHSLFNKKRVGVAFSLPSAGQGTGITRERPGSALYYLKRLGKLELSGIPQISHERLTCSDNSDRILQGIWKTNIRTRSDFGSSNFSFSYAGELQTNHHGLGLEPVFSSNDFKCCANLGKTVTSASKCCSGFAESSASTASTSSLTCKLPAGTNLMVYFNRFVSNEGMDPEGPGGGLVETDFDSRTGEPIISEAVVSKIRELGSEYCVGGKTRQGGAFGSFEPEPQGPFTQLTNRTYNIVDSANDEGQNSGAGTQEQSGYSAFMEGFRWNHHLYCAD